MNLIVKPTNTEEKKEQEIKRSPSATTINLQTSSTYSYPVKTVKITTCATLYQRWALTRKAMYAQAMNGLKLQVEYADTIDLCKNYENESDLITIVALHGAPGSHEDFEPFIKYFSNKNIRIIVPNYPDFNLTIQSKVFRHSAEEKFEFIKDFFKALNVKRIDLLLSHSSSVYPTALLLCDETSAKLQIKSVALFSPAGHRMIKGMRPAWFTEGSVKVYQNKFGRLIYRIFGKGFIKVTHTVTVKPESMNNVILSAQTMRYSNYKHLDKYLKKIKENKIPTLWVCSENDRLIEKEIFNEMIDIIGAKESNIQKYDCNGEMVSHYRSDSNIRVLYFNNGGHYAFLKYSDKVVKECDKFLNFVLKN